MVAPGLIDMQSRAPRALVEGEPQHLRLEALRHDHHAVGIAEYVIALLDALYGELDEFAWWIESRRSGFFVSAYLDSTRDFSMSSSSPAVLIRASNSGFS